MTEDLLQTLEEKMMRLLSEIEDLRKEVGKLHLDNANLLTEKQQNSTKLNDLISLLDTITAPDAVVSNLSVVAPAPMVAQG